MTNRLNRRSLAAAALAVLVPISVAWIKGATAQEKTAPRAEFRAGQRTKGPANNDFYTPLHVRDNADPGHQADHERAVQTRKLLSDYRKTEDEKERAKVLDELTKVVAEHFDIRQELREKELKALEEQVRKLRELHQRRAKEKDQIINDRVRQLLRDVDGLGWGDDGRVNISDDGRANVLELPVYQPGAPVTRPPQSP